MLTAVFGGTFNPLHIGHYEILQALQSDERIEKILLMPDRLPPHKSAEFLIDDTSRIKMCEIAAEHFLKCEVCLTEFERKGKSYTVDTMKILKKKYPNTDFAFVMGGDMLVYFENWYKYKKLIKMMSFIVFKRTATDDNEFQHCVTALEKQGMNIIIKDDLITNVSSTYIREKFFESSKLLPIEIYNFLTQSGGYSDRL